ncbi:CD109 antigen-like [Littorina saxatilis]|uniref:Uncharacterized protein n=1 Tax=Littorina saxatilis TaxID=31220 RepID=A0AAN9B323_9CAEN
MARWWVVLCALATWLVGSYASSEAGKYLVTAPLAGVPGTSYAMTLQIIDSPAPVHFSAYLDRFVNSAYRNATHEVSKTVMPGLSTNLSIEIPYLHSDERTNYRVHLRGRGGLQIEETFSLPVPSKIATAFVQLDRYAYEPGDRVLFKTFAIHDLNLTSYTGVYDITLKPPGNSHALKTWKSTRGAPINSFQYDLDTHTVLGEWTIVIDSIDTGVRSHSFQVGLQQKNFQTGTQEKQSETRSFEVKVFLPQTMNSSTDMAGSFVAKYPMDVAVKGKADIYGPGNVLQTMQFSGNGSFVFPRGLPSGTTNVRVKVTEDESGITGSGESSVLVYARDVKIEFTELTPAVFKPKIPFTAYVKISNNADEPLQIPAGSVFGTVYVYGIGHYNRPAPANSHYSVSSFTGSYPILAKKLTLPDSGLFSLDIDIPDDVTSIDLRVTFQGIQKALTLRRAQGDQYLQMYLLGDVPPVTDTATAKANFRVLSSQPLTDLTVEMVSRGQLVLATQPTLTNQATSGDVYSAEFSVTLTWEMTPVTDVVAYQLVTSGGLLKELATDSMRINVHGLVQNKVDVTSDKQRVEPGQEVTLNVRARSGSTVGLLVEENNGASVQTVTPQSIITMIEKTRPSPLSTNQAMATSQEYGSATFGVAHLKLVDGKSNGGTRTTASVRQHGYNERTDNSANPNTVFFGTNTTGVDGTATFTVRLPDTVGTWSVSGFALHSAGPVDIIDKPVVIETTYEVYGELLGPGQVVSGEQVILTAYIHNTRDIDSEVTVTLHPEEHVMLVTVKQDGTYDTSLEGKQQNVTVPAKTSKQVFFIVTSTPSLPSSATNTLLKLSIKSGNSEQIEPYSFTFAPRGVEQTITTSSIIDVNDHVTQDIPYVSPPKEALPGTITKRVTVTDDFDQLLLPLAMTEEDVMEEGTGAAALLNFALPVMLAKVRPDLVYQLRGPMERGHQRLLNFMMSNRFYEIYNDQLQYFMTVTGMKLLAEAGAHVAMDTHLVLSTLFDYASSTVRNSQLTTLRLPDAFLALAVNDLPTYLDAVSFVSHGLNYTTIITKIKRALQATYTDVYDPLTLSYLALANSKYGYHDKATNMLSTLLRVQDSSSANTEIISWKTNSNDTSSYFGHWLPDILSAATALQALVLEGKTADADRLAKWLFQQRKASGLFEYALDTIVATEALLTYSDHKPANITDLRLGTALSDTRNGRWLSQDQMTNFTASGQGKVFSQVEVKYRVTDDVGDASFEVVPVVLDESLQHFKLMICSRWLLKRESGITVQEVTVPSGFVADVTGLTKDYGVVKYIRRNETTTTVYFDRVGRDSTCYTLAVKRVHQVARSAPGYIVTRSFQTPENRNIVSYHPRRLEESTVCDLCPACCP